MGLNPIWIQVKEVKMPLTPFHVVAFLWSCCGQKMTKQTTNHWLTPRGGLVPRGGNQSEWLIRVKLLLTRFQAPKNPNLLLPNTLMDKVKTLSINTLH